MEALTGAAQGQLTTDVSRRPRFSLVLGEVIRIMLASVLLFSGLAKLRAPYEFLASVYGYELTGPLWSLVIATVLPWLEVMTAICLWSKLLYRGALAMAAVLSAVFSAVVGMALYRQLDISCGCFIAQDKIGYSTFLRSAFLLASATTGLILESRQRPSQMKLAGSAMAKAIPMQT
jgi:hypothetical protein